MHRPGKTAIAQGCPAYHGKTNWQEILTVGARHSWKLPRDRGGGYPSLHRLWSRDVSAALWGHPDWGEPLKIKLDENLGTVW